MKKTQRVLLSILHHLEMIKSRLVNVSAINKIKYWYWYTRASISIKVLFNLKSKLINSNYHFVIIF